MKKLLLLIAGLTLAGCATSPPPPLVTCDDYVKSAQQQNDWAAGFYKRHYRGDSRMLAVARVQMIADNAKDTPTQIFIRTEKRFEKNKAEAQKKGCNVSKWPISPVKQFARLAAAGIIR